VNGQMDPTVARLLGVLIARLLVDGWKPDEIGTWVTSTAMEIGRPTDVDMLPCRLCGQLMAEGKGVRPR
jgi:hypothetical protein